MIHPPKRITHGVFAGLLALAGAAALVSAGCAHVPEKVQAKPKMMLAENGKALAAIVVAADAPPSTRYASEELQRFLNQMTGASFELITDADPPREREIVVGANDRLHSMNISIDTHRFGGEGYVLLTKGSRLVVAGGEPRGTLYGVYGLLEDHLGCRWFTPEVGHIPSAPTLTIDYLDEVRVPVLEYREPFVKDCFDGDWCARNRMNSSTASLGEKHGGKVTYFGFVHTFDGLVPPEKYFDTHPEYFSLIKGKRVKERTQLCCTNDEVVALVTEEVRRRMREHPEATVFSVSQNDWHNYCECDKCTALAVEEGSQMGPMLYLVNAVARAVAGEFPDKAIDTLAYQYTRKPCKNLRPEPNVIIRLCSIECDFSHPFEDRATRENAAFCDDLEAWAGKSNRLWVWNYNTSFSNYLVPFPNLKVRGPNIRYMEKNNVTGIFEQDVYNTPHGEFSALSGYLGAKLLWNPEYDTDTAVNEFLAAVYGPAATPLRVYLDLIHEAVSNPKYYMDIWIGPEEPFLTDELLARADKLFDSAEEAVADRPEFLERVRVARMSIDYVMLERMRSKASDAYALDHKNFTVTMRPDFKKRVDRFFGTAEKCGLTTIRESGGELDAYKELLRASVSEEIQVKSLSPVKVGGLKPGLAYAYYEKALDKLPDFSTMAPDAAGVAEQVSLKPAKIEDGYALQFKGYLVVPADGVYSLGLRSNDGSRLCLGGELLIDNDGLHKAETKTVFVALKKGAHPLAVDYFESGGGEYLNLFWSGPGIERQSIPAGALKHKP
jgi:hypothetical protein